MKVRKIKDLEASVKYDRVFEEQVEYHIAELEPMTQDEKKVLRNLSNNVLCAYINGNMQSSKVVRVLQAIFQMGNLEIVHLMSDIRDIKQINNGIGREI